MTYDVKKANRTSGKWIRGNCPYRARPCGNPTCLDEAMRSRDIYQEGNPIATANSKYAKKYALRQAEKCLEEGVECPIGDIERIVSLIQELSSFDKAVARILVFCLPFVSLW